MILKTHKMFLGRAALPKSLTPNSGGRLSVLRRLDSSGERTHRQLIDCIRSKDTGKKFLHKMYSVRQKKNDKPLVHNCNDNRGTLRVIM